MKEHFYVNWTKENDILEIVSKELRMQALTAVELRRLWEEQRQERKKDASAQRKALSQLRETHQQLCQQIKGLYESFALREISKPEYLAAKAAATKQRDIAAHRISELEAILANIGEGGNLQNGFISAFEKYTPR